MTAGTLEHFRTALKKAGWFIPPYVSMGAVSYVVRLSSEPNFNQDKLEQILAFLYPRDHLAAMITDRIPMTPHVRDYQKIISEATEAHFLGLHRVAVSGLMPVIEGAGRKFSVHYGVKTQSIKLMFRDLALACKTMVIEKKIGAVGEIVSMLDSFSDFVSESLYVNSTAYQFADMTNRHGIAHGAYADADYGRPINFLKIFAGIEFLCFIGAITANVSVFAPEPTETSERLSIHFAKLEAASLHRPY